MSCVCPLMNYRLATEENVRNDFKYSHKVHFSKGFFRENIGDFTDLHNEKNSTWKLRLNGTVSVTGTRVNVYQIS